MDNKDTNYDQTKYFTPKELANFCFDAVAPHRLILIYRNEIESILMHNNIDSLQVLRIGSGKFAKIVEQSTQKGIRSHAKQFWNALREKMEESFETLNWKHIVNAVRHEMNDAIAQIVDSASSDLKGLEKGSGKALISAIKMEGKRSLTLSEAQYLESLIERATNISLPFNDNSYYRTF